MSSNAPTRESFSAVLLTQGTNKFYTLAFDSDILAKTCIATTRTENPEEGFQRNLDIKRAESIRDYVDQGGVIPGSIVLSAQENANLVYDSKKKTLQFDAVEGAFLIIDGQHRVYGFRLSKTKLRVPVVIFQGLDKRDEARLFIDINTLQKSVPNELLLDIKKLAETESELEQQVRDLFDRFHTDPSSFLCGLLSPSEKLPNKITRTTFLGSFKPLLKQYSQTDLDKIYQSFNAYLYGFASAMPNGITLKEYITKPIIFRSISLLFPRVARLVAFKHNKNYTPSNFEETLRPIKNLRKSAFTNVGNSYKQLLETLNELIDESNNDL